MGLLNYFREWIDEHGSAKILSERLKLLSDRLAEVERERDALKTRLPVLETELSAARRAIQAQTEKHKATISGELVVDDILWSYSVRRNDDKNPWQRLVPQCPDCRLHLNIQFVPNAFAFNGSGNGRYLCDNLECGLCDVTFSGQPDFLEDRAMRHIVQHIEQTS